MSGKPDSGRPEPGGDSLALRVERLSRENAALFERLIADEQRLRGLARSVWRVQEAERRRLAGELHDGLGQTLTALKIRVERLARRPPAGSPGNRLANELSEVAEVVGGALDDARRLSHLLRPRVLDDLGLVAALRWLVRNLAESAGFAVRVEHSGLGEERLPADDETILFRVAQEALTNSVKHSGAPGARVELRRLGRRVALTVSDRGAGFDPDAVATGYGLTSMRDRVELCGGAFQLETTPARGTSVRVELPIEPPAAGGER